MAHGPGEARRLGLLVTAAYVGRYGHELRERFGEQLDFIVLPDADIHPVAFSTWETRNVLSAVDLARVDVAFASNDLSSAWGNMLSFFGALEHAPNLCWLHFSWIGTDFPLFSKLMARSDLTITNAAGTNALPIATSCLAAMLALNRGLHYWVQGQERGEWINRDKLPARRDLHGQRVLIYGFGSIGQHLGRMCKALGLRVTGMRRSQEKVDPGVADDVLPPEQLEDVLPYADFVVNCAPLSDKTRGLFGRMQLRSMQRTAFLLNVGRGAVVDEDALADCLQEGVIAGAYLDVFREEPLPSSSPLWGLKNAILSPHDAATCVDNDDRVQGGFLENLQLHLSGGPLRCVVLSPKVSQSRI